MTSYVKNVFYPKTSFWMEFVKENQSFMAGVMLYIKWSIFVRAAHPGFDLKEMRSTKLKLKNKNK